LTGPQRGSLILLVLCLLAVLGIALGSFLAVSNQAMKLSNRSYMKDVSLKLAEMGLERSLSAFANGTFGSWTVTGTTAKLTFNISSSHYANSGITANVYLRVDNYDFFVRDAVWNASTNYRVDQYVLYAGNWYRCNTAHSNQTPGGANWNNASGSTPAAWNTSTYNIGDIVYRNTAWYRCIQANTNQAPPNTTYWSTAPALPYQWSSGAYNLNDIIFDRGTWYRCIQAHTTSQPPPDTTYWSSASTTTWSSVTTYNVNDYVSYGGVWYRCTASNTNQTPNNASYWTSTAPVIYAEGEVTLPSGEKIITQIRALVSPAALFPNAAAATTSLVFSSGGYVDSYDSSRGTTGSNNYGSTSSPYSGGSPNLGDSAVLAGGNTASTAVTVTTTQVRGYLAAPSSTTAPYAARYSVGASAIVRNIAGTIASPHPTAASVDLERISRSPNIPDFDILTPNSTTYTALPASGSLGTSTDTTWQTYVYTGNLNITDSRTYTVNGPVRIVVTGYYYQNLTSGVASIIIANNSTAKLEMYIGGDIALYGGGIDNRTRIPKNLVIYATTNSTAPDFNNTTNFYGLIYFSHNSSKFTVLNSPTFYGAVSGNNVTFSGSPNLHYDTSLRYTSIPGAEQAYNLTEWRELTDPREMIDLP
jgi:hypothetical protein